MNKKNIGYVSIELVITAALIMAVGFFAILNFNILGNESMTKGMERLDGTGVFSSGETTTPVSSYDSNGYDKSLNINPADINPSTDFEFYLLGMGDGYGISNYINETDKDVIIPKMYNGLQVVEIG